MIPVPMRKEMIDRDEGAMSVCNQCELLGSARSTLYYTPSKASDKDLKMVEPNQVWALDITYVPMRKGFMYLLAIMDVYSRFIVGWSLSNTMESQWVVDTLKVAIGRYGKPKIINSDQGSQFTSDEYVNYVNSLITVKISMDGKGRAIDNVLIERFFRTIKYEKIYLEHPETGNELHQICSQFIHYYNEKRDHSSIGDVAPIERYRIAA